MSYVLFEIFGVISHLYLYFNLECFLLQLKFFFSLYSIIRNKYYILYIETSVICKLIRHMKTIGLTPQGFPHVFRYRSLYSSDVYIYLILTKVRKQLIMSFIHTLIRSYFE